MTQEAGKPLDALLESIERLERFAWTVLPIYPEHEQAKDAERVCAAARLYTAHAEAAPACPHCGVPLTGTNSNPDECLHAPASGHSEPAPELREAAQARLDEFLLIKRERPIDPYYWDMHHERELRAALTAPVRKLCECAFCKYKGSKDQLWEHFKREHPGMTYRERDTASVRKESK